MTLGVVIPIYHGNRTIAGVVETVLHFAGDASFDCRIALVADGGGEADRTVVEKLEAMHSEVTALILPENVGQQKALYLGIEKLMDCDYIATMDDDGAHPVDMLPDMIRAISQGADLCYAVPVRSGRPFGRKLGTLFRDALFALFLGMPRGMRASAYRVMTATLAHSLTPETDGFIYLSAAAMRLKPNVACVHYCPVAAAPSRYTLRSLMRLYTGLFVHYTPLGRCFLFLYKAKLQPKAAAGGEKTWEP